MFISRKMYKDMRRALNSLQDELYLLEAKLEAVSEAQQRDDGESRRTEMLYLEGLANVMGYELGSGRKSSMIKAGEQYGK